LERNRVGSLLLLEEVVECLADIIDLDSLSPAARSQWNSFIWLEIVAIVCRKLVSNVFRLRFAALIVLARVEKPAVLATVQVCIAMRTLIAVSDLGKDLYLATAVMTDHTGKKGSRLQAWRC
jgi:hypothetical protein